MGSEQLAVRTILTASILLLAGCGTGSTQNAPRAAHTPQPADAPGATAASAPPRRPAAAVPPPPEPPAAAPALADASVAAIDAAIEAALRDDRLPGCVVAIGRSGGLLFEKAYGARSLVPDRTPMSLDTVFDLASVTKPVVTATAIMQLAEAGRLSLDAPVARYLPAFARHGKEAITVRQLLLHSSGLPAADPLSDYLPGRAASIRRVLSARAFGEPGARFRYSDVGFIALGALVEAVTGERLDRYATHAIFEPLGMGETTYLPGPELRARAAPTELRDDAPIRGDVDDPRAYRLGGVAGNAGLFSTARDLARFARMMLGDGSLEGARVLEEESVRAMTRPVLFPNEGARRGLGWSMTPRSEQGFSREAFGHGGYTGTWLWIDPGRDLFVVFLSNAVHPTRRGPMRPLELAVAEAAVRGVTATEVRPGIDVLRAEGFAALAGARVGLITNASGRAVDGERTVDLLYRAPGVDLRRLFSPEHGLGAHAEGRVGDARDAATGLPIRSLFGAHREPAPEDLADLDALVLDLQDVGTRFYTYASTMRLAMQAAARAGVRFVVLDRPNPLGGLVVEGPTTDPSERSFVNSSRLPIRHGMTIGELARLFRGRQQLEVALEVVPLEGWRRGEGWEDTGLRWVPPSPNLPRPAAVRAYPAVGLLEGTNVTVGRGTDRPFEVLGAPWMDPEAVLAALSEAPLPGVRFEATRVTPERSRYRGVPCPAVAVHVSDPGAFRPVRTGLALARALLRAHPRDWQPDRLERLLAAPELYAALLRDEDLEVLEAMFHADEEAFRVERERYLLYP